MSEEFKSDPVAEVTININIKTSGKDCQPTTFHKAENRRT